MPDGTPNGSKAKYAITVLVTILLALIGGILKEVIDHGKQLANITARLDALTKQMEESKAK